MTGILKNGFNLLLAAGLYAGGAFVGLLGSVMTLGMGFVAIFWGTNLVHEIMISAAAAGIGLTIADSGRKKYRALAPTVAKDAHAIHMRHAN